MKSLGSIFAPYIPYSLVTRALEERLQCLRLGLSYIPGPHRPTKDRFGVEKPKDSAAGVHPPQPGTPGAR